MKIIASILAFSLALGFLPAEAQNRGRNNDAARRAMAEKRKKDQEKKAERERVNKEIDAFLKDHDKNGDGSVSLEEYVASSSNAKEAEETFKQFNKNRDRYLSKTEIKELLGL